MTGIARAKRLYASATLAALTVLASTGMPSAHGEALRISGLLPFEQGVSGQATPVVEAGALEIAVDGRTLRISPWPAALPQEFEPQHVDARRVAGPAGPSDRVSMRPADGGLSWLELAAGARVSTPVVGGWKLQHTARGWWLAQGAKLHFLGQDGEQARPIVVPAGMDRWCVHLLDSSVPAARPGAAPEGESHAAWAAIKLSRGQRCGTPRPGLHAPRG